MIKITLVITLLIVIPGIASHNGYSRPTELSLEECLELARENNNQIEAAQNHKMASSALRKASYTKFFPGFDFTGSYLRMNKEFNFLAEDMLLPVVPISAIDTRTGEVNYDLLLDPGRDHPPNTGVVFFDGEPLTDNDGNPLFHSYTWLPQDQVSFGQKNNYLLNLGMTQPLYTGGKIRTQYQVASHIESIANYNQELKLMGVLYETEQIYWQVYTLQEKFSLAKEYHSLLENMVDDLGNLHDEGIISQNDLLKARVRLNEASLERTKAQNGLDLSKMALCRMIGLPITTAIIVSDTLWIDEDNFSLDELLHDALENRPELKIASTNVELGESAVKLAESRFLPDIALSANYFMANPDPYHGFSQQFGRDWNVGIVMRIPVFHWNERRHILSAAKHEKKVQELKLRDYRELIQLEVNKVFYKLSEMRERVKITALSLEQATENLRIAEDNFEVGTITTTELLEAQTLWREANTNHIDAKSNLKLQQTNMQKAIGELINDH